MRLNEIQFVAAVAAIVVVAAIAADVVVPLRRCFFQPNKFTKYTNKFADNLWLLGAKCTMSVKRLNRLTGFLLYIVKHTQTADDTHLHLIC